MFEGKIILVVDDEVDLREILRDELSFEGARVDEAGNGIEAMAMIQRQRYDAVLSDIRMPGGDGTSLVKELRDKDPCTPSVVLITGFADVKCEEALAFGAEAFVTKPFHLADLKKTLERLLKGPMSAWRKPFAEIIQKKFEFTRPVEALIQEGLLQLGRGGFFLHQDPHGCQPGDYVQLQFPQTEAIGAKVRWLRTEAEGGYGPGLGLEIASLSAAMQDQIQQGFPQWFSQKAYIPRG